MKFQIDYNRKENNKDMLKIGGVLTKFNYNYEIIYEYTVEINTLEELQELQDKVHKELGNEYSLILNMEKDNNNIYLDDQV